MKVIRDMKGIFTKTASSPGPGNCMIVGPSVSVLIISICVLLVGIIS